MSVTTGTFPGVRIVDMPDLGALNDTSSVVGERAGSGRFSATQLRSYVLSNFAVTPQQYGAKGDGVANDTAAFNAALAAIAAQGGGKLYIPSGDYRITGPLTYASGWLKIEGAGKNTVMQFGSTTADFMTFAGPDITLTDFSVVTPFQTSTDGGLFNFTNSNNAKLNRIWTDGGYEIVQFLGDAAHIAYRTSITDCNFVNVMQNGVFYSAAYGGMGFISDTEMLGAPTNINGSGIIIEAGDTFSFTNVNIAAFKFGVNVISVFLTGGYNYVANIFAANVLCDGAGSGDVAGLADGWFFDGTNAGTYVSRVHLSGCWAGTMGRNGFSIKNATDVTFSNCIAINNNGHGFHVAAPSSDITFTGCTAAGNSVATPNTNDGIHISGVVTDFIVSNCRLKPLPTSTASQKYGLQIEAVAADRYVITNNNVHGNMTGGILDGGTGVSKIVSQNIT